MMGDRPPGNHHHTHHDLYVVGFAVPTVAVFGQSGRTMTGEIGTRQIVEDQVGLEVEQVAETLIEATSILSLFNSR